MADVWGRLLKALGPIRLVTILALWLVLVVMLALRQFAFAAGEGIGAVLYSLFLWARWRFLDPSRQS